MSRAPQTNERAGAALRPLTFDDHLSITGASTSVVAETRKATSTSLGLKLVRGHLTGPAVLDQLEAELLTFRQIAHASPLDGGDVHEGVLAAVVGLDETETFGGVKPLHCAISHDELLFPCVEDRSNADAPSEVISRVLGRGHQRVRGAGASPHGGLNEQPKIDDLDLGLMRPEVKGAALYFRDVFVEAAWRVALAACLVWWTPSIALRIGALVAARVRFGLVMQWSRILQVLGQRAAAVRVCERERDRCAAKLETIRARRGW